jgi:hypothetical protein
MERAIRPPHCIVHLYFGEVHLGVAFKTRYGLVIDIDDNSFSATSGLKWRIINRQTLKKYCESEELSN